MSILSQSHEHFRVIICYDDDRCLEYLQEYIDHPKITIYKAPPVDKTEKCFYNVYCNFLMRQVKGGWIIFLDDDDMFTGKYVLKTVAEHITTSDDFIMWPVRLGGTIVAPSRINDLRFGQIGTCSFCFHSHHGVNGNWTPGCRSDYEFIVELLRNKQTFNRKRINSVLVRTQHRGAGQCGLVDGAPLAEVLQKLNVRQAHVSSTLAHLEHRFAERYSLTAFTNPYQPAVFLGIYSEKDIEAILNHKGISVVLLYGTDVSPVEHIKEKRDVRFLAPTLDIQQELSRHDIFAGRVSFDLLNHSVFTATQIADRGHKIFVHDGSHEEPDDHPGSNRDLLNEIVLRCPNDEFIFSSRTTMPYDDMAHLFAQCRIGLKLATLDTTADMVKEMQAMKIPVVHNRSEAGLRWNTIVDILEHVNGIAWSAYAQLPHRALRQLLDQHVWHCQQTMELRPDLLATAYSNVDIFDGLVSGYKSILFIGGRQGALQGHYIRRGHHVHTFNVHNNEHIEDVRFVPDLVILQAPVNTNLREIFKCPIFYLIDSIYKSSLDTPYHTLTANAEHDVYINKHVISQIERSDHSFVNSPRAQQILKAHYDTSVHLFYNTIVPYVGRGVPEEGRKSKRKYQFGLIVRDFGHAIENVAQSVEFLKEKDNVILIGEGSEKYEQHGFTCVGRTDPGEMQEFYRQIECLVQDSFFEPCSATRIGALFNGCKVRTTPNTYL